MKIITKLSLLETLVVLTIHLIIQEICHEDEDYYEYSLGHFENDNYGGEFMEVFSWTSDYGESSIFR